MLFTYPPEATTGNWLHWCLAQMILQVHKSLESNQKPPAWPESIPIAFRSRLRARSGLKKKLAVYTKALKSISDADRLRVYNAIIDQNRVRRLLSNQRDCERIGTLPAEIRAPTKELFRYAFELLSDLEIRDNHYRAIYNSFGDKLCPFCGLEYFESPRNNLDDDCAPREDDDHYLPRSQYPFAAANLWNLVPMGHKCNSKYKLSTDPILNPIGSRRRATDPYGNARFTISLMRSTLFGGSDDLTPTWEVDIDPQCEESETWDDMFKIRLRYQRDVLDPYWKTWLSEFSAYARTRKIESDVELKESLEQYCRIVSVSGFSDRSFLKVAMFNFLIRQLDEKNDRLVRVLNSLVKSAAW